MKVKEAELISAEFLKQYLKDHNLTAERPIRCTYYSLAQYVQCTTTVELKEKAPDVYTEKDYYFKGIPVHLLVYLYEKNYYFKGIPVHLLVYLYEKKARFTARIDLAEVELHESYNV